MARLPTSLPLAGMVVVLLLVLAGPVPRVLAAAPDYMIAASISGDGIWVSSRSASTPWSAPSKQRSIEHPGRVTWSSSHAYYTGTPLATPDLPWNLYRADAMLAASSPDVQLASTQSDTVSLAVGPDQAPSVVLAPEHAWVMQQDGTVMASLDLQLDAPPLVPSGLSVDQSGDLRHLLNGAFYIVQSNGGIARVPTSGAFRANRTMPDHEGDPILAVDIALLVEFSSSSVLWLAGVANSGAQGVYLASMPTAVSSGAFSASSITPYYLPLLDTSVVSLAAHPSGDFLAVALRNTTQPGVTTIRFLDTAATMASGNVTWTADAPLILPSAGAYVHIAVRPVIVPGPSDDSNPSYVVWIVVGVAGFVLVAAIAGFFGMRTLEERRQVRAMHEAPPPDSFGEHAFKVIPNPLPASKSRLSVITRSTASPSLFSNVTAGTMPPPSGDPRDSTNSDRGTLNSENLALDASGAAILKEGWLTKEGLIWKSWKRRWFVLTTQTLSYYPVPPSEDPNAQPKGIIRCSDMMNVELNGNPNDIEVPFELVTAKRTYYLQAASKHERQEWMDTLWRLISKYQFPRSSISSSQGPLYTGPGAAPPGRSASTFTNPANAPRGASASMVAVTSSRALPTEPPES